MSDFELIRSNNNNNNNSNNSNNSNNNSNEMKEDNNNEMKEDNNNEMNEEKNEEKKEDKNVSIIRPPAANVPSSLFVNNEAKNWNNIFKLKNKPIKWCGLCKLKIDDEHEEIIAYCQLEKSDNKLYEIPHDIALKVYRKRVTSLRPLPTRRQEAEKPTFPTSVYNELDQQQIEYIQQVKRMKGWWKANGHFYRQKRRNMRIKNLFNYFLRVYPTAEASPAKRQRAYQWFAQFISVMEGPLKRKRAAMNEVQASDNDMSLDTESRNKRIKFENNNSNDNTNDDKNNEIKNDSELKKNNHDNKLEEDGDESDSSSSSSSSLSSSSDNDNNSSSSH